MSVKVAVSLKTTPLSRRLRDSGVVARVPAGSVAGLTRLTQSSVGLVLVGPACCSTLSLHLLGLSVCADGVPGWSPGWGETEAQLSRILFL